MTNAQNNTASPSGSRPRHQHSKSATQTLPNSAGKQSQRRNRSNRNHNGANGGVQFQVDASPSRPVRNMQDPAIADTPAVTTEGHHIAKGSRNAKQHTRSQPSIDHVLSPPAFPPASTSDTELPGNLAATPGRAQAAYAGPTFHASPAPSTLPIPKFLSKSVPAKSRADPPTPPPDGSESNSPPSPCPVSPSRAPVAIPPRHEDSPLDLLFKADRAERARHVSNSPASGTFSPNAPVTNNLRQPSDHNSQTSLHTMFPIELDGASKKPVSSPPPVSPAGHRSTTAPSRLPQVESPPNPPQQSPDVMQDLLARLSQSQKKPVASTPPRNGDHAPSNSSSRHQSPSPFQTGSQPHRSASGPTTPAPPTNDPQANFFYGNRNLSPLFKAAKGDPAKRNSGLRTELTANSSMMPQDGFGPPIGNAAAALNVHGGLPQNNPDVGARRGSAPHVQPHHDMSNNRKQRTPGHRVHHSRPDSFPRANAYNSAPPVKPVAPKPNPFIPASVQAKKYSNTASTPVPTNGMNSTTKATAIQHDPRSLEQDLKRLLNLNLGPPSAPSTH